MKRTQRKFVTEKILHGEDEGIALLTMDNEEGKNTINMQLLEELSYTIGSLAQNWSLRAVILQSAVKNIFSSGMDLKEYVYMTDEEVMYLSIKIREILTRMIRFPIPTIALIKGPAIGTGAELSISCDFRIGNKKATFSFPDTRLGLIPFGAATQRLSRLIGRTKSKELLLTGRRILADEAMKIGLLDYLIEDDIEVEKKAFDMAREIANGAPLALRSVKKSIEDACDLPYDEALVLDREFFQVLVCRKDREEAVRAFVEKRRPNFKGN